MYFVLPLFVALKNNYSIVLYLPINIAFVDHLFRYGLLGTVCSQLNVSCLITIFFCFVTAFHTINTLHMFWNPTQQFLFWVKWCSMVSGLKCIPCDSLDFGTDT
jgi:hypothetical protein